jgi:hypothetical protein
VESHLGADSQGEPWPNASTSCSSHNHAFYEWLLSDHLLAIAERRRRQDEHEQRRARQRARLRELDPSVEQLPLMLEPWEEEVWVGQ